MWTRFAAALVFTLTIGGFFGATPSMAADRLVVLELFTSQGCDRCPPVDEMIRELAQHDDILPLALHVDYWDYMGWEDSFALDANVLRQMAYAPRTDRRRLFTPLIMIGGLDPVAGFTPMKVIELIQKHRGVDVGVALETTLEGDHVRLTGHAERGFGSPVQVLVVHFKPHATVDITRGQNAGRTVNYTNVVTAWHDLGRWDGRSPMSILVPRPEEAGAVLVQSPEYGLILAASRLP